MEKGINRRHFVGAGGLLATSALGWGAELSLPVEEAVKNLEVRNGRETRLKADVLVCGGGPSGMAAAVMAARQGARVLLVERYGRMGGMAVQALVGPLMGNCKSAFVDQVLRRIGGRTASPERLDLDYAGLVLEAGAQLMLHSWVVEALVQGKRVTGVRAISKQGWLRIEAKVTVDATGDGDVAFLSGAAFEQGRPGDGLMQPVSIQYRIGGVSRGNDLFCGSEEEALRVKVPEGIWHDVVQRGQLAGELPASIGVIRIYKSCYASERVINATQVNGIDGTKVEDLTRAELAGRQQAFQVLAFLQKHAPGYEQAYISAIPAVIGVRETRRFLGANYLTRTDCTGGRKSPEAVVRDAQFVIDIHNPAGSGQAERFAAKVKPYDIPYGCLVPREVDGLLLAGRCISGSHEAHASYRVQCIAMAIGAAAGAAAGLAAQSPCQPREVAVPKVQRILA
jgi:hypothetical protein